MQKNASRLALRIALIYFVVAGCGALLSNQLQDKFFSEEQARILADVTVDLSYALVSAFLLHQILRRLLAKWYSELMVRKRVEADLEESDVRHRSLFENMNEGVAFCRMIFEDGQPVDFIYLAVNQKFTALTGLQYVTGERVSKIIPSLRASDPELFEIYGRVASTGKPEKIERYVQALQMWFVISVFSTQKDHFTTVFDVITARKEMEQALRASEEQYRKVIETSPDCIFILQNYRFVLVNPAALILFGVQNENELLGREVFDFVHPEYQEIKRGRLIQAAQREQPMPLVEEKLLRLDGSVVDVEVTSTRFQFKGEPALLVEARDITERKLADEALRESQALYYSLVTQLPIGIFQKDLTGRYMLVNQAFCHIKGMKVEDFLGRTPQEVAANQVVPTGVDGTASKYAADGDDHHHQILQTGKTIVVEEEYQLGDGRKQFVHVMKLPVLGSGSKIVGTQGILLDITERKLADARLQQTEERYQALFNRSLDCVFLIDFEGRFLDANQAALNLLGYTREEIPTISMMSILTADQVPQAIESIREVRETGFHKDKLVFCVSCKDGQQVFVETRSSLIYRDGKPYAVQGIARDITERKRADEALRQSEQRFRKVLQQVSSVAVQGYAMDGTTQYWNKASEQLYGYTAEEAIGRNLLELVIPPEMREGVKQTMMQMAQTGEPVPAAELELMRKDGSRVTVFSSHTVVQMPGRPVELFCIDIDLTDRKRAEAALRESEERFFKIFESSSMAISLATIDEGYFLAVNTAFLTLIQRTRDEVIGHTALDLNVWLNPKVRADFVDQLKRGGEVKNYEMDIQNKSGQLIWILWSGTLVEIQGKQCLLASALDITDRKRAEAARRRSEQNYGEIFNATNDAIFLHEASTGRILDVNEAMLKLYGYHSKAEVLATDFKELLANAANYSLADTQRYLQQTVENGPQMFEWLARRQNGEYFWVEVSLRSSQIGGEGCVLAVVRDITERKHVEIALRESEERFRSVVEGADIAMFVSLNMKFNYLNPAALSLFGAESADQLIGQQVLSRIHPDYHESINKRAEKVFQGQKNVAPSQEEVYIRLDGTPVSVEATASPITYQGQRGAVVFVQDITERKIAEASHARLATAVEQAAESIVITNVQGEILYVNPAFEKTSGYSRVEAIGQTSRLLKSGKHNIDFYRRMWATIAAGRIWTGHFINRRKDGTEYEEEATISPVRDVGGKIVNYVAVKRDVTREVLLEAQFRQSQKMEAIGQLAGGVAHDFNNILAVIQLQAGLLRTEQSLTETQLEYALDIEKASQRAANLTRQLLLFSRKQSLQLCDVDLNEVVTSITKMLQRVLGEQIQMLFKFSPHALLIHADAGMIDQVLMNLTVNARDAMAKGGQLIIETSMVELTAQTVAQSIQSRPGSFACLSVTDTGCGIAPENLQRIFDPFYTTKDVGKGTGLGLATVFGIIQQHQGWINVYSELGRGTTFRIYLPLLLRNSVEAIGRKSLSEVSGGTEGVLLVEDDDGMRVSSRKALTKLGYQVWEAANASAALTVWDAHCHEIQLLITDLVMPGGTNGKELAEQLCELEPTLKVIYVSGYSADIQGEDFQLEEGVNFLAKPYEMSRIAEVIRNLLDKK